MSSVSGKDLSTLVPLKVLQHVNTLLATEEVLPLDDSPIEEKVQLAPTVPNMNLIYQEISQAKAAKNDDATANTKMWDDAVFSPPVECDDDWKIVGKKDVSTDVALMLHELRSAQHHVFKSNVFKSYENYMTTKHGGVTFEPESFDPETPISEDKLRDISAGFESLEKAGESSFWEWPKGSSPFFLEMATRDTKGLERWDASLGQWKATYQYSVATISSKRSVSTGTGERETGKGGGTQVYQPSRNCQRHKLFRGSKG